MALFVILSEPGLLALPVVLVEAPVTISSEVIGAIVVLMPTLLENCELPLETSSAKGFVKVAEPALVGGPAMVTVAAV